MVFINMRTLNTLENDQLDPIKVQKKKRIFSLKFSGVLFHIFLIFMKIYYMKLKKLGFISLMKGMHSSFMNLVPTKLKGKKRGGQTMACKVQGHARHLLPLLANGRNSRLLPFQVCKFEADKTSFT